MTEKKPPADDPDDDRLEIEDLASDTEESLGPQGGGCISCQGKCVKCGSSGRIRSPKI
jgi:hypothetical protein